MREDFVFDPEDKLRPPLRAFRRRGEEWVEAVVGQNRVVSHEFGLELVNTWQTLRRWPPPTGESLRTPAEGAARRATKLRALGLNPDQL